jgi:sugar O-acyltransferase (sialic acid O-acetyltransferase NeuD family)
MLIIGAGGLAAQIFPELPDPPETETVFWSETDTPYTFLTERHRLIRTDEEAARYFREVSPYFLVCLGGGRTQLRADFIERFQKLGGMMGTHISQKAIISPHQVQIEDGAIIMNWAEVEPGARLSSGCLISKYVSVAHGVKVDRFAEVAPHVVLTGDVEVGEYSYVGLGSIVLPGVKIGRHAVVAAGTVVRKNVPDHALVYGNPSVTKKKNAS